MKSVQISVLASAVGMALLGASLAPDVWATNQADTGNLAAQSGTRVLAGHYMITFSEAGLVSYHGGVAGFQGTAPVSDGVSQASSRKFNITSSASQSYKSYLASQRAVHIAAIEHALGRPLVIHYTYGVTRNAISAELSASEAAVVAHIAGVANVSQVRLLQPDTFRGPTFIGANTIWDGTGVPSYAAATRGQGVKVGVIDTGTNIGHPSFTNDPACGFSEAHPKLHPRDCTQNDGTLCTGTSPNAPDGQGHGVHTSSTAAGNTIDNTVTPAPLLPDGVTMSGVAPCADLYPYRTAEDDGSLTDAAITAAIQNAIVDQVDVINFSIGPTCGGGNPWDDSLDFLAAEGADVFVAASAGNTRATCTNPTGLVANNGPWMITVAASTQDQQITPQISAVGPGTPPALTQNIALIPGNTTLSPPETTDLSNYPLRTFPTAINGCLVSAVSPFPANYFTGTVAIIQRGTCSFAEKILNAYNAGAHYVVITNNQAGSISMDTSTLTAAVAGDVAAFSTLQAPGDALIAFVNANEGVPANPDVIFADGFDGAGPAGAIGNYRRVAIGSVPGDVLAAFSFRGPTQAPYDNLTKPDITGPGVNIYAAFDTAEGSYGLDSGTSMSSPHLAGAAALVRAVQPSWSPMEVKSAILTTATLSGFGQNGTTPWTVDEVGSGRVDLTKATRAGVTLDETPDNFIAADPSGGTIDMRTLNLPSLRDTNCGLSCSWTRKFKNRLNVSGTWTPTAIDPPGYHLTFSPASITMAPGFTQSITITATATAAISTTFAYGRVDLHESASHSPDQHLTVAVRSQPPTISVTPAALSQQQATNTTTTKPLTVTNVGGGTLTWNLSAVGAQGAIWNQPKNGTNGIVSDYSTATSSGGITAADFVVTGTNPQIRKILAQGFDNTNTLSAQAKITWRIYSDAAGQPNGDPEHNTGTPVWAFESTPTGAGVSLSASNDITLDLVAAGQTLNLPAGTYWLTVYPTYAASITTAGAARWNWYQAAQVGFPGELRGSAFSVANWTSLTTLGLAFPDVAFRIDGDIACGAPWLSIAPTSGSDAAGANTPVTATFNSTGLADGTYTATACIASNDPVNALVTIPVTLQVGVPAVQPVQDPGFETTTASAGVNPKWDALDTNSAADGGTNFYSSADFSIPIHEGVFTTWFGGWGGGDEVQHISQSVTFPATGPRFLNYWQFVAGVPDEPSNLIVSIDGVAVSTTDVSAATPDSGYVQKSINVSTYANGAAHVVKFQYTYADAGGGDTDGNIFIDAVTVDATAVSPLRPAPSTPFHAGVRKSKH